VESLLLSELESLGALAARETVAGVYFNGPLAVMYRACLWSRLANRILWPLAQLDAGQEAQFYEGMREVAWGRIFSVDTSFAIDFSGQNSSIRHSRFGAQRAKDAIVDAFLATTRRRPSVDRSRPDVRLNVRLVRDRAHVSVDLSGGSLHRRGYRQRAGAAPLKENLAAAILLRADWPGIAARGGALIDPMCGSGTLLLEGAMMAADIAPALERERFGFEHLALHDAQQWQAIIADARGRAKRGRAAQLPEIRGYDWDPASVRQAQASIARMGLGQAVRVSCKPVSKLRKPSHRPLPTGLLVCNPPYGERIGEKERLRELYRELGAAMLSEFPGWQAALFTSDLELGKATGLRSHKRYALYNGALPASLLLFDLGNNVLREQAPVTTEDGTAKARLSAGAEMFANRIRKNRKRLSAWARREQVECYRVYDADMPEYAVAVDIYGDHVHVAEYKAPGGVSPDAAEKRLDEVRSALPEALGIDAERMVFKQRSRQRGKAQYERLEKRGEFITVREGRARLLVNLRDYLDTGLFLDHRPLRLRIGLEAADRDFLNLFCYTGSATVHAALGGARSTTSVDLSNTYLDWLRKNLRLNDLQSGRHRVVRDDCREWLQGASEQFDLILLDPPSFSNSKSMDQSFDVQRDHARLVGLTMERLRNEGTLYFSSNLRGFVLDDALRDAYACEDISEQTLPEDFRRNRRIHQCWIIRHAR
jgi:23S rRNA (guanine2445-N2)-methyltransferase / 23S rRNA (guanine2069-N7)-methyltransferase